MKHIMKKIADKAQYAYLRRIKKWMYCPNCKEGKMSINKKSTLWQCESCGYELSADEFENDYVFWFCDNCGSYLNVQDGFDRFSTKHFCTNCGYENDTSENNIKGICIDCGKLLPDPDGDLCADCRIARKERAVENLKTIGKGLGMAAVVLAAATASQDNRTAGIYKPVDFSSDNDIEGNDISDFEHVRRCANCGNTDENTLWDEGDTFYCSKCGHRTRVEDGEDDSVECPYCHRMRDRKAMYCRWCNDATWETSSPNEFKEIDELLKEIGA